MTPADEGIAAAKRDDEARAVARRATLAARARVDHAVILLRDAQMKLAEASGYDADVVLADHQNEIDDLIDKIVAMAS